MFVFVGVFIIVVVIVVSRHLFTRNSSIGPLRGIDPK